MENALQSPAVTAHKISSSSPFCSFEALLEYALHSLGQRRSFHWMGPSLRWLIEQVQGPKERVGSRTAAASPTQLRGPARSQLKRKGVKLEAAKAAPQLSLSSQRGNGVNPRHMTNKQKILSTKRCMRINRNDVLKHCMPLSIHKKQAAWAAAVVNWNECSCTQVHLCRDVSQGAGCMYLGSNG